MQLKVYRVLGLLIGLFIHHLDSRAQSLSVQQERTSSVLDTLALVNPTRQSDLFGEVRDSLEIALLKTTQTYSQLERLMATLPAQSPQLDLLPSVLPVAVPIDEFSVSSPFGLRRHPVYQQIRFHAGVDVKAPAGMVVKATAPGIIKQVGCDPVLGVFVRIHHAFGFETTYGHLLGYCVKPGQSVARHEEIGKVGSTGLATGPHLHYVLKKNGSLLDPYDFCFLLRRRLWLYKASKESAVGKFESAPGRSLSSKDSYPNSRN